VFVLEGPGITCPTNVKLVAVVFGLKKKKPVPGGRDGGAAGVTSSALTQPPAVESYITSLNEAPFQVRITSVSRMGMISFAPLVTPALRGLARRL